MLNNTEIALFLSFPRRRESSFYVIPTKSVIPAEAGNQVLQLDWIPTFVGMTMCAGMTEKGRFRGSDEPFFTTLLGVRRGDPHG